MNKGVSGRLLHQQQQPKRCPEGKRDAHGKPTRKKALVTMMMMSPPCSPSSSLDDKTENEPCVRLRNKEIEEQSSLFELIICDSVLFYMMRNIWTPSMRYSCSMVNKRWNAVANNVQLNIEASTSIAHGIYMDNEHLSKIIKNPRMNLVVLDQKILEEMCKHVCAEDSLNAFLTRGIVSRANWIACLLCAIEKNNGSALERLSHIGTNKKFTIDAESEMDNLLRRACMNMNTGAIHYLVTHFPASANLRLDHPALAQWCSKLNFNIPLLELLNYPSFRTRDNITSIMMGALESGSDLCITKLLTIDQTSMRPHGQRILKRACELGWTNIVQILCVDMKIEVNAATAYKLLQTCIANGNLANVKVILTHPGSNPGFDKNRVVRDAMRLGKLDIALHLLSDVRVDIHNHSNARESLLCLVCSHNSATGLAIVDDLFRRNTDPNQYEHFPIRIAAATRNYPVLRLLMAHGNLQLTKSDHSILLNALTGVPECNDLVRELVHAKKYLNFIHSSSSQQQERQ